MKRRKSKVVEVGGVKIGGNNQIPIQSMANIKTSKVAAVSKQINQLAAVGCDIVRVSILDNKDAEAIAKIKKLISIPIVADIHFDYNLAIGAIENGADKIRINPGNIGEKERIEAVVKLAKKNKVPIRIGANSGSLDVNVYKRKSLGENLANSAIDTAKFVESLNYNKIVLSAKAHSVEETFIAYRKMAAETSYPLHLGVTASGAGEYAVIKSSVGIGGLLSEGIGDTIRVSLTDKPLREIEVGRQILQSIGLAERNLEVIACPTCGRTEIDVMGLAREVEAYLIKEKVELPKKPFKVAVMGCIVNGPGEARDADIAITGGRGFGFIVRKEKIIKKVEDKDLFAELLKEIKRS